MATSKHMAIGYVVKNPKTGKYFDDDRQQTSDVGSAEQFFTEQDAENYRDQIAYHTTFSGLIVVAVRVTTEEF